MPTLLTLALISSDVYDDTGVGAVAGYRRLAPTPQMAAANTRESSFFGAAYSNGAVGVIAFRGSKELKDWTGADLDIGRGRFPLDQWSDALTFFSNARSLLGSHGCDRFVVTGHSLGGGLTQLVAAGSSQAPVTGVTFNAPGMASLTGPLCIARGNVSNLFHFRARRDPVSLVGVHLGSAPVTIDVDLGLRDQVIIGAAAGVGAGLGALVGAPSIGGAAGAQMARGGLEHTLGPMIEALRSSSMGGVRY